MPNRTKRNFEDFDPNKSDSADSTYDASTARPPRPKSSKINRQKPPRKRQRTAYGADGSEDISESEVSEESYGDEEDKVQDDVEIDERTGRPKRKITKKRPLYQESEGDSEAFLEGLESPVEEPPPKKQKGRSLMIKLNVRTPQATPGPTRRSTRARSGSISTKQPKSAESHAGGTRRSSRIAHDESETVVALTNSGHHAEIIRPGTRSPEGIPQRALRGGKGLKQPPSSAIFEEEEHSSANTKEEPEDDQIVLSLDPEIAASREDLNDIEEPRSQERTDTQNATQGDTQAYEDEAMGEAAVVPESDDEATAAVGEDDDDDDEGPINKPRRNTRRRSDVEKEYTGITAELRGGRQLRRAALRSNTQAHHTRSSQRNKKGGREESSDFEPVAEEGAEEDVSDSEDSTSSPRKASQQQDSNDSSSGRRSTRLGKERARSQRRVALSDEHDSEVAEELAEELQDLRGSRPRRTQRSEILFDQKPQTRKRKPVDYRILKPDLNIPIEDDGPPSATTPSRRGRGGVAGGGWQRSLFSTYGPFGGAGGPPPVFGMPGGIGAAGGVDSDSSDDENMQRPRPVGVGGTVGMTPTTAIPPGFGLFPAAQAHGADPLQGTSGTPANLGKVKDKQALADADPLGVDPNVNFDSVGGLQGHIDQLKEMVALPLLYPEVFQRFHVTPPRGVLFHGPPGTGKTLLARALASSVSSQGRKVTFYMRKGADALSKWVGEAERQLRLLFEEARKNQPSIIFFDEIDGLAPVRSSKQEQIHASIVSTLLALMDGMDGRGQVIVIGATNRPDSIDPALRRPGRFDREFYFPLPNREARRAILDIHTKGWEPPLQPTLKDELAEVTKGYGGADLRALCTEAALNAVQRRYPQIYKSNEKLQIRPETISIAPKDFMISVKKMVPSSERSASSGAVPLPKHIEPLLRHPLMEIENVVAQVLPQKKRLTALEEAAFEDAEDDRGMKTERMQQEFERSRVFRPRLLVRGEPGMGQQYLAGALLNHFEGLHVQSFDLSTLLSDSTRSSEAAVVQLFTEVRRHKPSVIYIPNVDTWYRTLGETVIRTFQGLLRSLAPTEPVLLLGVMECDEREVDPQMVRDLFGFSMKNQFDIPKPTKGARHEYFTSIIDHLNTSPNDFPEPANRKKRVFEVLPAVPAEPAKEAEPPSKEELRAQKKKDRLTLNVLKMRIQPTMDQMRLKYKVFRTGVIDESQIRYLLDEDDPSIVNTDLPIEQRRANLFRPYEKGFDDRGEPGLVEQASGKFFYNLEIVTIEKRLSNGYYKRPKDFLSDVRKLTKDAKMFGDPNRLLKANELQSNVEVDMGNIESYDPGPAFALECENVFIRETKREKDKVEKAKQLAIEEGREPDPIQSNVPPADSGTATEQSSGPIVLGLPMTNGITHHPITPLHPSQPSTLTNGLSGGLSDLSDLRGHAPQSNGTSVPSRGSNVQMTNSEEGPSTQRDERETQNSSFGPSAQTRPPYSYTGGPATAEQRRSQPGSLSQRSAITPMVEGSHPHEYTNDASTTSSDQRFTGSSGPFHTQNNTQSSNIVRPGEGPDLSMLRANSELPDTQGSAPNSSQSQQAPSQVPAVPPFPRPHASGIHSLLNNSPPPTTDALPPPLRRDSTSLTATGAAPPNTTTALTISHPHPPLQLASPQILTNLLIHLADQTSPCSVEQLEQIYSALMSEIWDTRAEWDRGGVVDKVVKVFEETMDDIRNCQGFGMGSLEMADDEERQGFLR